MTLKKIISGGQTGVDQGALMAAIDVNLEYGGWCPPGRACESGVIPQRFKLQEAHADRYNEFSPPRSMRTFLNVKDSDGTLILFDSGKSKGTTFTIQQATRLKLPLFISDGKNVDQVVTWLKKNNVKTLNVAGPSEKEKPGVYHQAFQFISQLLETMQSSGR